MNGAEKRPARVPAKDNSMKKVQFAMLVLAGLVMAACMEEPGGLQIKRCTKAPGL